MLLKDAILIDAEYWFNHVQRVPQYWVNPLNELMEDWGLDFNQSDEEVYSWFMLLLHEAV